MKLNVIDAGFFKLDGGAMFGVVPKTLWSRNIPSDDANLCNWAMRCLLIEDGNRLMLVDTGMGDKQDPKWLGFYQRNGDGELIKSIRDAGYSENEVTDVIFSHLHFDHAGGGVRWNAARTCYETTFANARYWTHSAHWNWATANPNVREKASFLNENLMPIYEAGQLHFSDQVINPFGELVTPIYVDGHTEKMMMLKIAYKDKTVVFMADTAPSHAHIPLPYVMGYDVRPLQTITEKEQLFTKALENNYILMFDHDPFYDCCTLEMTERGIRAGNKGALLEFL